MPWDPKGYFHSTTLMQAFLRGFCRVKQNRARGGLGRISGPGFLGCFFLRPSSWGEDGSMAPLAVPRSPVPPPRCPLLPVSPAPQPRGLDRLSPLGRACPAEPAVGVGRDYSPCSRQVKLASARRPAAWPELLRPGSCHSFPAQPVTSQYVPEEVGGWGVEEGTFTWAWDGVCGRQDGRLRGWGSRVFKKGMAQGREPQTSDWLPAAKISTPPPPHSLAPRHCPEKVLGGLIQHNYTAPPPISVPAGS